MLQMTTQSTIPSGTATAANIPPLTTFSGTGTAAASDGGVKDMDMVPPKEVMISLP
jgi:hypothetical protein